MQIESGRIALMPRIKLSCTVDASADHLFDLASDYTRRLQWDPFMKSMEFPDGEVAMAKGVRSITTAYNGMRMETVFIAFQRPEVIAMDMTWGPWMFRSMSGTWRFSAVSPEKTDVLFAYHFTMRPRIFAWLLNPVTGFILKRDMRKRIKCLKQAAEA